MSTPKPTKKGAEFLCHVRFKNTIPDPPVDCKLIDIPTDLSLFTKYAPTDLERDHQYEIPANLLQTPLIDFVDLDAFKPNVNDFLDVEDEALLVPWEVLERKRKMAEDARAAKETAEDDSSAPFTSASSLPMDSRRPEVTWLRRTEYISSEFSKNAKSKNSLGEPENITISHARKHVNLETLEDLFECIERSFKAPVLEELVHPANPKLRAVQSIPLFPGMDLPVLKGVQSFTQCLFDVDPKTTLGLGDVPIDSQADTRAILRAMSDPNDPSNCFVWYYLPPKSTESLGEDTSVYVRDYDIQRNEKSARSYILLMDENAEAKSCSYVPVTAQFHLRKRRLKASETRQPHMLKIARAQFPLMNPWILWFQLALTRAMLSLNLSKLRQVTIVNLNVIQENGIASYNVELDAKDTTLHLYALISKRSGFDEDNFKLYLDDKLILSSTASINSSGCSDGDTLLMKIVSSSPPSSNDFIQKGPSADLLLFSPRLRKSLPNSVTPLRKSSSADQVYCRTPRIRVRQSKIICFHRLSSREQRIIREAFHHDIIHCQRLTIILENKYPELIEEMFRDLENVEKFFQMLTPELMIEIDEIEEQLKSNGEFTDDFPEPDEQAEEFVPKAEEILHIVATVNQVDLPVVFDCMVLESTLSFAAFFEVFPEGTSVPESGLVNLEVTFGNVPILIEDIALVHDTEPWLQAGLSFMFFNRVVIDFEYNELRIQGETIQFS